MFLIMSSSFPLLHWELSGLKTGLFVCLFFFCRGRIYKRVLSSWVFTATMFSWFSACNSASGDWRVIAQENISGLKNDFFCVPEIVASVWKGGFCFLPPLPAGKLW